jgi:hypothetical protein
MHESMARMPLSVYLELRELLIMQSAVTDSY